MLPDLKPGESSISSKPVPGGTSLYWLADSMLIDPEVWGNLIEGKQSRKKASLTGVLLSTLREISQPGQNSAALRSKHWEKLNGRNSTLISSTGKEHHPQGWKKPATVAVRAGSERAGNNLGNSHHVNEEISQWDQRRTRLTPSTQL